ncbi:family 20 glycosylhydrolase [Streptomyces silaceus]|uniref:family 20 glycosylhydrolase n=1 Tax=Streptomyces silaceus TaxID=545123 RepID=UPI00099F208B|nr:family 20 glycosylhydrolase [Streptomyces silaceus]
MPRRRPRSLAVRAALAVVLLGCALAVPSGAEAKSAAGNPAPVTVPALRNWQGGSGTWELTRATRIVLARGGGEALRPTAALLADELADQEGIRPAVVDGRPRAHDIVLGLGAAAGVPESRASEGYALDVGDELRITARERQGVLYGTRTLLQALRTAPVPRTVARGTATDWPTQSSRGQMLDVGRKYFPVAYLKQQIRQTAWYKLNTFHLHLSDWNGYRIESASHPEIVAAQHYTRRELTDLEEYAARYGVTIVPEIDLPGHAVSIGDARPDLAFTCEPMSRPANSWEGSERGHWTLDYTKPETRAFAKELIAEVAQTFPRSPYVHIGTDELPQTTAQDACPELVAYQKAKGHPHPGDVLVEFTDELDAAVRSHGKTTQIWQWWDFGQETSIDPDKRIVVNEWLSGPEDRAAEGYQVVGSQDGPLYVSPGFGAKPGSYGFFDVRTTYRDYPFTAAPGIQGYRVSRWSDRTQTFAVGWVDHFARRPLAVVADRTWATPAGSDVRPFLDRYDQVGDATPVRDPDPADLESQIGANPGMLPGAGFSATATSEETAGEPGGAARAVDNDPYTHWHSAYDATLPQQLTVDLGSKRRIAGLRYMPRQDSGVNGMVKEYEVLVSDAAAGDEAGEGWRRVARGAFPADRTEFIVPFPTTDARRVALRVLSEHGGKGTYASVAELDVVRGR